MKPFATAPASPMRIALIDDVRPVAYEAASPYRGGPHTLDMLAMAMAHHGHMVDIYRCRGEGEPAWEDIHERVRVHRVGRAPSSPLSDQGTLGSSAQAFAAGMRRMIMDVYPSDVIHAWGLHAGLAGLRLSRGVAVPFVWTMTPRMVEPSSALIAQLLVDRADAIVALGATQRDALMEIPGATRAKIHLIPPGVDTHRLRPGNKARARGELGVPQDAFVVLLGGAMPPSLLADMGEMSVHVLVLGEDGLIRRQDPTGNPATSLALPMSNGFDRHALISLCCAASDVFLAPCATDEGTHIGQKEAMACGLPVLALTRRNQNESARIVEDGVTGHVLHAPRNDTILNHLRELRDQRHLRGAMGMAAVLRARTFFSWDKTADRMLAVYTRGHQENPVTHVRRSLTLIQSPPRKTEPVLTPVGA